MSKPVLKRPRENSDKPSIAAEKEDLEEKKVALLHEEISSSVLDHIGYTPLVRINSITSKEGLECEVLG